LREREETAARLLQTTGACLVPPFDHLEVIAGQGTVALEFLEQVPELDAIVAPVGGGGLISGIGIAAKAVRPDLRVFAAEPATADDAFRSHRAGRRVAGATGPTIADGLRTGLGELTWPYVRDLVEQVFPVTEEQIVASMRLTWERAKLMIESSSAVAVAAVTGEYFRALPALKKVGVILTGGNVDLYRLPWQESRSGL
jgi:threonine dehydratase